MIDRAVLGKALGSFDLTKITVGADCHVIVTAARERLAQLPETCERCNGAGYADDGSGRTDRAEGDCRGCNGTGTVYPQETIDQAFAVIKSLTNPRYVIYSEWQLGGAAIHEQDEDDRLQWL